MKRKLLTIALAAMLALGCLVGLVACGGNNVDGTYYVYMEVGANGEYVKQEEMTVEFKGGKAYTTVSYGGESQTQEADYEVKGNKVVISSSESGVSVSVEMEIVENGILKQTMNGVTVYYCKDGKTPPSANSKPSEDDDGDRTDDSDSIDGIYYIYDGGDKIDGVTMTFEDGKVTQTSEVDGEIFTDEANYKTEGDQVIIYFDDNSNEQMNLIVIEDGILKLDMPGESVYYCKDGKTPPAVESAE